MKIALDNYVLMVCVWCQNLVDVKYFGKKAHDGFVTYATCAECSQELLNDLGNAGEGVTSLTEMK